MAFIALIVAFLGSLAAALAVIPPWQQPDEPQHVVTARLVRVHGGNWGAFDAIFYDGIFHSDLAIFRTYAADQRLIIASMARYRWWNHYGRTTPDPLPVKFMDVPGAPGEVVADYFGPGEGSRLYYRSVAALFRAAGIDDLLAQMYVMRALSALAGLLTLGCVWAGTRLLLDDRSALVVASLLALHPQYLMNSTAASPDAFVNLAGGVVWWRCAALFSSGPTAMNVASLWAGSIAAFAIRRMGAPLLLVAAGVTIAAVLLAKRRVDRATFYRTGLTAAVACVAVAAVATSVAPVDVYRAAEWVRFDVIAAVGRFFADAGRLPSFLDMLFRTFWLAAGWLRYQGPPAWHAVTVVLTAIAATGLFLPGARRVPRTTLYLALSMAAIQIGTVTVYQSGFLRIGPQGRYLFPVLAAILSLIWLGWRRWFLPDRQALAAVSLVLVMLFLNITAWTTVILPAYAS